MKVEYTKSAVKTIQRMDASTKMRIKCAVDNIPDGDTVKVDKIAPRGQVYKEG